MSERILIIGASVRAAAESATRAGFDVIAADLFGDVDLLEVADFVPVTDYPHDFAKVVAEIELPVLYTGGLENYPAVLAQISELRGNRGHALERVRDPFEWTPLLATAGRTAAVRRHTEPPADIDNWLLKPLAGAGGNLIRDAADGPASAGSFFQQRMTGTGVAAVFVGAPDGSHLVGVTHQLTGLPALHADRFAWCGSLGPIRLPDSAMRQLQRIGDLLTKQAGLRGLFGVDAIRGDEWIVPIEVNPRYTGSVEVLELATGRNLLAAHCSAFANEETAALPAAPQDRFVAKLIVYARRSVVAPDLMPIRGGAAAWLADLPQPGSSIPAGAPFCSVLAQGDSLARATEKAIRLAGRLPPEVVPELDDLRRDLPGWP